METKRKIFTENISFSAAILKNLPYLNIYDLIFSSSYLCFCVGLGSPSVSNLSLMALTKMAPYIYGHGGGGLIVRAF